MRICRRSSRSQSVRRARADAPSSVDHPLAAYRPCHNGGVVRVTRRQFLGRSLAAGLAVRAATALARPQPAARFVGLVPLSDPKAVPLHRLLGTGLDARLFTDLSTLAPESLITATEHFYVRTACPDLVRIATDWTIRVGGLVRTPSTLPIDDVRRRARDLGAVVLECSGNNDPNNYGLISAATWQGVPLRELLETIQRTPAATHLRFDGVDHSRSAFGTSIPGASWIFPLSDLEDAFLATGMNGRPLTFDHGAPVRLVVPRWYGCSCIKWVNRLEFVDRETPPTGQMIEFAERTHQRGTPALARDFAPATVDHAAFPVRVEQWSAGGRSSYRIVGILWGGDKPRNDLEIRFAADLPFVPVSDCLLPRSTSTWALWTHEWRPEAPGTYEITLRIADRSVRTRRLDAGFYRRQVTI